MAVPTGDSPARAAELRGRLADQLVAEGAIRSAAMEAAIRAVSRHVFVPGLPLELAYSDEVVFVKRDRAGVPTSSVSAPDIQAIMLEQAGIEPGARLLEIGSGGYNAALMAELAGPSGEVTTVDIDREVADRARRCLDEAGYERVRVLTADAEAGVPDFAPYDRIIVTVEAWDLPPAWRGELVEGGRLVVPLRLRGLTRSIAFDRVGERLVSRSAQLCGFVKMQGAGHHADQGVSLFDGEIFLDVDDAASLPSERRLEAALRTARVQAWSGVKVWRWEPWDTLPLWLATRFSGFCQLTERFVGSSGEIEPALRLGTPAVATDDSLAYLSARTLADGRIELGVHAYGPHAPELAEQMSAQVAVWDEEHRHGPGPTITASPSSGPVPKAELVVAKRHVLLAVDWPPAPE